MKLNNKGFTLVELLGVVVILSVIMAIMVPSVNYLINRNKEDNYESLKAGIISAAKVYVSDNRYNITLDYADNGGLCSGSEVDEDIVSITEKDLTSLLGVSKLPISLLVEAKTLTTNNDGKIVNPRDNTKTLNLSSSYVLVKYQCSSKNYTYSIEDASGNDYLIWE